MRSADGDLTKWSKSSAELAAVTLKLLAYCQANNWAGYDPYDALNSKLFKALPSLNFRLPRLIMTQALKRMPLNPRSLLLIPKTQNPKALALILGSLIKLLKLGLIERPDLVDTIADNLSALRSQHTPYWCWGYSFPWQTRSIVVPRGAPNLICTVFVANALLDLYEMRGDQRHLEMVVSSAEYILSHLYWTDGGSIASLAYPLPTSRTRIHNANLLGSAFLLRVAKHSGQQRFTEPAWRIARYSAAQQRNDGSWFYGEGHTQLWIDNFHTGYNLSALHSIGRDTGTSEFEPHIRIGFEFYYKNFVRADGAPKYFHDQTYPIDIHCVAQSVITLLEFRDLNEGSIQSAHAVLDWAMTHMWDEAGYFYYRVLPLYLIRTSYMRWSQAWMLLALSTALEVAGELRVASPPDLEGAETKRKQGYQRGGWRYA